MSRRIREETNAHSGIRHKSRTDARTEDPHTYRSETAIITWFATLLPAVPAFTATSAVSNLPGGEKIVCAKLNLKYPKQTFYPDSIGYTYKMQ
jgi:hypothetical protein